MKIVVLCLALLWPITNLSIFGCAPPKEDALPTKEPTEKQEPIAKLPPEIEFEKTLALAKQEGKVMVYSTLGVEMRIAMGELFGRRYGLELELLSGRAAEISAKIGSERRAGLYVADIFISGPSPHLELKGSGFLQPIEPQLILPEVTDKKVWQDGELLFVDRDKLILVFASHVNTPVIINTELVSPPIKSVFELLEPRWKGKILMGDPTISGAGNLFVLAVAELHGISFLQQLAKQDPTIVRDYRTHVEWVARGKYPIGTGPNPENVYEFVKAGAPIAMPVLADLNFISSGTGAISLLNKPAHPNAAKLFVNWLLTKEGQTSYVKGVGSQSRRLDVTTEYTSPERIRQPGVKYFDTGTEELAEKRLSYLKINTEIFGQFLK